MSVADNIAAVLREITRYAEHAGVPEPRPTLIAVSKRQPDASIEAALAAGQRVFGENQVQEAERHWAHRRGNFPDLKLHMIGHLQTNKAQDAVELFDSIDSVDRPKLADKIKAAMDKTGRSVDIFIQVNTGEEPQKGGVLPGDLEALLAHCKSIDLPVKGLMCIPPQEDDAALHFALLKKLQQRHGLEALSMGMSADYPIAAAMGATHVRVGTAIFGQRSDSGN